MNKKNKVKKIIAIVLMFTMMLQIVPTMAHANEVSEVTQNLRISEKDLEKIFIVLDNVPEEMLETASEAEIETYLNDKGIYFFDSKEEVQKFNEFNKYDGNNASPQGWWEGVKCIGAIALFLGGAGAIIKGAKALVKAAGGVRSLAVAIAAYVRTGVIPEWASKQPSLAQALSYVGGAILSVTGLDECTKVFE